jgi:hypothetical protein
MLEMKYMHAILNLRPNALFSVIENNYDSLEWLDTEQTKPTKSEIDSELLRINDELKLVEIRTKRNELLINTDKYSLTDYPHATDEIRQAWLTYRQDLRNITNNLDLSVITLEFDSLSNIQINNLTFPNPPS